MPKAHPMCLHIQKTTLRFVYASQTISHVILVISKSFFSQFSAFKLHSSTSIHVYMHAHIQIHIHTHTLYTHAYTNITKEIERKNGSTSESLGQTDRVPPLIPDELL